MKANRLHYDVFRQLMSELEKAKITQDKFLSTVRKRGVVLPDASGAVFSGADSLIFLETAIDLTGDPCLAIRLGQKIGIESYGTFGFALMTCANQRESIALLERYGKIVFEPAWQSYEQDGGLILRVNFNTGTPEQQQLATELCISALTSVGTSLNRGHTGGAEIQLTYPEPPHLAYYQSAFPVPIKFNADHNQLWLPSALLDTPVRTANPSEHVVFHQQCEEMLRSLDSVQNTTTAVRRLLIQSAGQFLNISEVADRLHVSERTLRRRLSAESTTFTVVFEEIRNLLAREYLSETSLTVAEIAYLLNYAETVNFRRAFVRWNGQTPNEFRKQPSS
ncbi:AraC family transcriptional regulator [Oceanicoccus sagamiensis]|uniref:AraC family transcriptional regulator n=1 Tax=Oceanicoccus sagamiensis TaxID=716816 RepID=A0A1X9N3E1_9GAMM|nr:AraC family transcriptional regulator [Oceanicoccus sagamiensis]ARN72718.1 AraC family transcriptional regulator [Oceanicoccus sagamiensis]